MRDLLSKLLNRTSTRIAAAMLVAAAFFGISAGPSFATIPVDPLGGELTDTQLTVQTWVLTIGVPALALATVLGIIIRVGFKWLKRVGARTGA